MGKYSLSMIKKLGYLRVAGATTELKVADVDFNLEQHLAMLEIAEKEQIDFLVFPDFSLTGVTCGDLFKQNILLDKVQQALDSIRDDLKEKHLNVILTVPQRINHHLCKVLYILSNQEEKAFVLPTTGLSSIHSYFSDRQKLSFASFENYEVLDEGSVFTFEDEKNHRSFAAAVYQNISELYAHYPLKDTRIDLNLIISEQAELAGQHELVTNQIAAFASLHQTSVLYNSPSFGESTTDFVYSGRGYIYEGKDCLANTNLYESDLMIADIDLDIIQNDISHNQKLTWFPNGGSSFSVPYSMNNGADYFDYEIHRNFPKSFFVPAEEKHYDEHFESIMNIVAHGLAKRLSHIHDEKVVLGLSGGSDSTIALLIALRAQKILNQTSKNILCVSMPGFGTTSRTFNNTKNLAEACGANYLEVRIHDAVNQHFIDIEQDPENHDVTFENAQARERTQILMDLANQRGGLVLGTGDMSEAALGFATYGGDHLSMYNCNAGIPKTLIRHLIRYEANRYANMKPANQLFAQTLLDVLDTPVSPELLPPKEGEIAQKTENIVGPYELHDFFIYQFMKYQHTPKKMLFLAEQTFAGEYDDETILYWLKMFYKRFFNNQFKRSASPDGPAVNEISFSPRKGLVMPSDAVNKVWLEELED